MTTESADVATDEQTARMEACDMYKLPTELLVEIFGHLDFESATQLCATNRYFRSTLHLSMLPREVLTAFFRRLDYPYWHNGTFYPSPSQIPRGFGRVKGCALCCRAKPLASFSSDQLLKRWGRTRCVPYCFKCAREKGIYKPGTAIHLGGKGMFICLLCEELQHGRTPRSLQDVFCGTCRRERLDVEGMLAYYCRIYNQRKPIQPEVPMKVGRVLVWPTSRAQTADTET